MNKTALKNFATNARKELIEKVKAKAFRIGITEESIKKAQFESSDAIYIDDKQLSATEKKQREKLIYRIKEIGYKQVVEEVAYTWFNRFTALRFMEVNNYLPTKVRVLSSSNYESSEPDIIKEALTIDLDVDKELVYSLKLNNKTEELFKYLVIKQCNNLNKVLPFMFETIDDYKEILFPEGLLVKDSFIRYMTNTEVIPEEYWEKIEVVGWLYQYYIADEKDRVFKEKKKYKSEEIPFATQLFTPDWIVRYMVQNSLGRYWVEAHPDHYELINNWEFFLGNQQEEFQEKIAPYLNQELDIETIKCFDPAMGSGHILVYMFDVLYEIYSKCGYMGREIPRLIIENNLYGLDIDDRAVQLASFSVVMKALEYNRSFLRSIEREGLSLNITSIQETNRWTEDDIEYLAEGSSGERYKSIKKFINQYYNAKTFGSLIKLTEKDVTHLENRMHVIMSTPAVDLFEINMRERALSLLPQLIKQTKIMNQKYDILIMNPPYMSSTSMNNELSDFIKRNYPNSKADLFACFMEVDHLLKEYSYLSSINQQSWMFLSSFENLRENIIRNKFIDSMLHLGSRAFEDIGGEVVQSTAFVLRNIFIPDSKGKFIRLIDEKKASGKKEKAIEVIKDPDSSNVLLFNQEHFRKIPGSPIAYWISPKIQETFSSHPKIGEMAILRQGLATGNNERFIREWFEVNYQKIHFSCDTINDAHESKLKWFPINKGGPFRKWYGNQESVIAFDQENYELLSNSGNKLPSKQYYFKEGMTWTDITSGGFSGRYVPPGFIFDSSGQTLFTENTDSQLAYLIGYLNSVVAQHLLDLTVTGLHYRSGYVSNLPFTQVLNQNANKIVEECIKNVKIDWDAFETSWNFLIHPLLNTKKEPRSTSIELSFIEWKNYTEDQFSKLKRNEEELNRIFIESYNLQDELTPFVEDKSITIRKANYEREIKSFISYAIGCSFGRYSLDEKGLIYAGGKFDPSRYDKFPSNKDNILPILSGLYFHDDIVSRLTDFIKITFGEDTFEENLNFIVEAIGRRNAETALDTLRRYLLIEFYKDHVQTYKKRPIYWLFTSGKERAFNCLIYMHRYDKSTLSRIRTDYLHEYQIRLDAEKKDLLNIIESDSTLREISNAKKELKSLDLKIEELRVYDEKLHHMADMQIEIDLDDGVAVNYAKFEGLLAPIK